MPSFVLLNQNTTIIRIIVLTFLIMVPYMYFINVLQLAMTQVFTHVYAVIGDGISLVMPPL